MEALVCLSPLQCWFDLPLLLIPYSHPPTPTLTPLQDVRESMPLFSIRQSFMGGVQDSLALDRQSLDDIAPYSSSRKQRSSTASFPVGAAAAAHVGVLGTLDEHPVGGAVDGSGSPPAATATAMDEDEEPLAAAATPAAAAAVAVAARPVVPAPMATPRSIRAGASAAAAGSALRGKIGGSAHPSAAGPSKVAAVSAIKAPLLHDAASTPLSQQVRVFL